MINIFDEPFPHIIIDDVFSDKHLSDIMLELEFYRQVGYFSRDPSSIGSARTSEGDYTKKSYAMFMSSLYKFPESSPVCALISHVINGRPFIDQIKERWAFHPLWKAQLDKRNLEISYIVNYYESGDSYLTHRDSSVMSSLCFFNREPRYKGGELVFPEYNHLLTPNNNQMIIFPSCVEHGVYPVDATEGYGRYSVAGFIGNIREELKENDTN